MKRKTMLILFTLFALAAVTTAYAAVVWSGSQSASQSHQDAAFAELKAIGLPISFVDVEANYTEPYGMNVTVQAPEATLTLSQLAVQRTQLINDYTTLNLYVLEAGTDTVVMQFNFLSDLEQTSLLTTGVYEYDLKFQYNCKLTTGTTVINWDVSLTV
jgi:hypothetical protein